MLLFNELDIRLIIWCGSSSRYCERKRGQQQERSYNRHEPLSLLTRPSFVERRYSSCLKSRYTLHAFIHIYDHPETPIMHSATCVSHRSNPKDENVESRYLSCNNHASKGALQLYHDEPRIKNPLLRATGLSEHAVTSTTRVARLHEAPEAENCNCNCREACGVTDRDQERTQRRGTCDL